MSIAFQTNSKQRMSRKLDTPKPDHDTLCGTASGESAPGFESDGWFQHVSVASESSGWPGEELLRRSVSELPGNLRFAWDGLRILLIGEVPLSKDAENSSIEAEVRLRQMLSARLSDAAAPSPDDEQLATLIAECGLAFEKRERGWVLPSQEGIPELTVSSGVGGAWAETVLAPGERFSDASRDALVLYLSRAHRLHRFVRFVVNESDVRVISLADTNWLEIDLFASVNAVLSAGIRFRRGVAALRSSELAVAYLGEYGRDFEHSV